MNKSKDIKNIENNEIVIPNDLNDLQSFDFKNAGVVGALMKEVFIQAQSDRNKALETFEAITKEFDKTHHFTLKGEIAAKFLEAANKSTGELNKLIATMQKFNSDKVQSENADKLLGSVERNNFLEILDQAGVGPSRLINKENIEEIDYQEEDDEIDE